MLWTPSRSRHQLDVFDVSISWIILIIIEGALIYNSELMQKDGRGKKTANLEWQAPTPRRLALGCKLQILVSLRVLRRKSVYLPIRSRLGLCIKKFTKNAVMSVLIWLPWGFSLSLTLTNILGTKTKRTLLTSVGTIQIELEFDALVFKKRGKPEYQEKTPWRKDTLTINYM